MKLIIGNDHAGIELKKEIVAHLHEQGYIVQDVGVDTGERSDYPIVAKAVAQAISDKEYDLGILICGTGIGMSIAANKYPGVRSAAVSDVFSARLTRQHNNANILCLGQWAVGGKRALELVDLFVSTPFDGESTRHQKRLDLITQIENQIKGE